MSSGTLKNAQQGAYIPQSWDDLLAGVLGVLDAAPVEDDKFRALLRGWDEKVGALPPAVELSVAERAHLLFTRAIPEVGIRLGAIAALTALRTRTPIDEWLWLVEPFDARFFGKLVRALFRYRRPDLTTNDERKGALEEYGGVDWRTVERWYTGRIEVPNGAHLESLGSVLGDGTERMLRGARLACVLRGSLREWIGNDSAAEWFGAVADVGRVAARALADPAQVAMLLRWVLADLDGLSGDDIPAFLQSTLPRAVRVWPLRDLCARLASAASDLESGSMVDQPVARWAIGLTLAVPHPRFSARVCGGMLGLLPVMDIFRLIAVDWMLRSVMKGIAAGSALPVTYVDGSRVERPLCDQMREAARHWEVTSLRFRQVADDSPGDFFGITRMLFEVLGSDARAGLKQLANCARDPLLSFIDAAVAMGIPDELVAQSRSLCLLRARAFAERGDSSGALDWVERARFVGQMTMSETDDLLAMLSAIAHAELDGDRAVCRLLHTSSNDAGSASLRALLVDSVALSEGIVTAIMEIGQAPDASHALLATLVAAIPVAIRIVYLREELSSEDDGFGRQTVEALVSRLRICLDRYPTHGRGWAVVAYWTELCGGNRADDEAAKLARHYGAADFIAREVARIGMDRGLPEDAG